VRCMLPQLDRKSWASRMLKMARELAGHCYRPQMIEAMPRANGFPEASEFIEQPHIRNELRNIAVRAGRRDETEHSIR
jgi:hypothetical protein